jgi:cytochrome c peroxidase
MLAASSSAPTALAASIGRGEVVFNTKPITIDGVGGINGPSDGSQASLRGTCSTCHSNPNVGNVSVADFLDIGVTKAAAGGLDVGHLPTYTFRENGTGRTVDLTDPGRGRVTGRFADLGKTKIPNLRGLATRAPYFHNGSAKDFATLVAFYERRFGIGFTAQEKEDLIAFLGAL